MDLVSFIRALPSQEFSTYGKYRISVEKCQQPEEASWNAITYKTLCCAPLAGESPKTKRYTSVF